LKDVVLLPPCRLKERSQNKELGSDMKMETASVKSNIQGKKQGINTPYRSRNFLLNRVLLSSAIGIILFIIVCAIVPSWIAPYSPTDMNASMILKSPNMKNFFGTDYFGRDVFSLVVHGARDSLLIGLASVVVGGLVGATIGALAGYIGKVVDMAFMRFIDVLMVIPGILLALAIAAALGPSLRNTILAVSVASIPGFARVMRSQVISIKSRPFIDAARSVGTSHLEIVLRHVLPNSLSPLIVMATIGVGSSILVGSGLSFLGLGEVGGIPDWGMLLSQGRGYLTVAWWITTFPGLAITILVLSINLIGDELRDYLDPKNNRA
jgi:peptide/nickel transport system permease protein